MIIVFYKSIMYNPLIEVLSIYNGRRFTFRRNELSENSLDTKEGSIWEIYERKHSYKMTGTAVAIAGIIVTAISIVISLIGIIVTIISIRQTAKHEHQKSNRPEPKV